jgi:8-oxo-dGTP diphosphatase
LQEIPNSLPKRGVGVLVTRGTKILLGKRKGAHCAGTWAPPGGKENFPYESPTDIADRELGEETGMQARSYVAAGTATNFIDELNEFHRSFFIEVTIAAAAEPQLLEPEKCEGWVWFEWDQLPTPLFPAFQSLIDMGWKPATLREKEA